jgi:acyl-CoA thioesterase FadM
MRILGADAKRIHAAFEITGAGSTRVAAVAEVMLLHVQQQDDTVTTTALPAAVSAAIGRLQAAGAGLAAAAPGSRRMELRGSSRAP